jgi:hypothetical protein
LTFGLKTGGLSPATTQEERMTMTTTKTKPPLQAAVDRVWYETFGGGWEDDTDWVHDYRFVNGDWERADGVCLKYESFGYDYESKGIKTITLAPMDVFEGWLSLVAEGAGHCGSYAIGDLESMDSCSSSMVIERAVKLKEEN